MSRKPAKSTARTRTVRSDVHMVFERPNVLHANKSAFWQIEQNAERLVALTNMLRAHIESEGSPWLGQAEKMERFAMGVESITQQFHGIAASTSTAAGQLMAIADLLWGEQRFPGQREEQDDE